MPKKSVLIIDDEKVIRDSFSYILQKEGIEVTTAENGIEALPKIHSQHFDIVLTDMMMPQMNGLEILKAVKKIKPATFVIIITGYGDINTSIEAMRYGADDFLLKPCDTDDLMLRISRCFEKHDLFLQLQEKNRLLQKALASTQKAETALKEANASQERKIIERTALLTATVKKLSDALIEKQTALQTIHKRENELESKNLELNEMNMALRVLLKRRDKEQTEIKEDIMTEIVSSVFPFLKRLKNKLSPSQASYLQIAQANLMSILTENSPGLIFKSVQFAPREIEVINYIKQDKSTKEIADIMELSVRTIESYRDNIRKKIGIKNKQTSLKKFIISSM